MLNQYSGLSHYIFRPVEFVEDLLLRYYPTDTKPTINRNQMRLLRSLEKGSVDNKLWKSIRSGRGRGKTTVVAWIILWYLATRPNCNIIVTAPKQDLLSDVMWKEIAKWLVHSPLSAVLEWKKERILNTADKKEEWYAIARTARSKENFSGFHAAYQLMICDEASGAEDEILETMEQTQTNNAYKKEIITILISNPTKVTGYFYKTQTEWADKGQWDAMHFDINAEEEAIDDGAIRAKTVYGEDSDIYRVSILGEFPSGNPRAVVQYTDFESARMRDIDPKGKITIGADIARFGDDSTVFAVRIGNVILPLIRYSKQAVDVTERCLLELVRELRAKYNNKDVIEIRIDDSNMGSGGIVDRLGRNDRDNIEVVPVNFGGKGDESYGNMASIMWGAFAKEIHKLSVPDDGLLREEVCGRNWQVSLDNKGRMVVETKSEFKKRSGRSPDRADAVIMACFSRQIMEKILPLLVELRDGVFVDKTVSLDKFVHKRADVFGSVWLEKSMKQSCLVGVWDKDYGKLHIFYEGFTNMGGPAPIISSLNSVVDFHSKERFVTVSPRRFSWYANRAMFGLSDGATSFDSLKDGPFISWQNAGIFMNPNFFFDISGAILELNKLVKSGALTIMPDLIELRRQLETWSIDNDRPDNDGHSLCLALANIVSMLVYTKKIQRAPKPIQKYSGSQQAFLTKAEKLMSSESGRRQLFLARPK